MIYRIAWILVLLVLKVGAGFRVRGKEYQVPTGPVVVVSNHVSNWDPLAVGTALNRKVHFMGKQELFKNPLFAWLLKELGVFPVKRGVSPKSAIVESLKLLQKGEMLGIFPEGTRSKTGEMLKPNAGAVMFALKAKAPILPIALKGTKEFKNMSATIGPAIYLDQYYDCKLSREDMEELSKGIMKQIKSMLDAG